MQIKDMGEFTFIDSITEDTISNPDTVICGIGDDCAVYKAQPDCDQLISTDMMVEGIHFSAQTTSAIDIGYRLGAANISDIAAMGGTPKQIVVSVAASPQCDSLFLQGVYDGLKEICKAYHVNIIGGDTVSTSGPLTLSVTIIGEVPAGAALYRSAARVGDIVGVTGTVGNSAVGLEVLQQAIDGYEFCKRVHRRPEPQVYLGNILRGLGVHAMNDISDGLAGELNEIAYASQVSVTVAKSALRFHTEVIKWSKLSRKSPWDYALHGGEDFQLVFTAPADLKDTLCSMENIQIIGKITSGTPGVWLKDDASVLHHIEKSGYNHFK